MNSIYPVPLDEKKLSELEKYYELLIKYNEVMNLTAITEKEEVKIKHFADSLSPLSLGIMKKGMRIADVGSGAGFPGMPLKIAVPELSVTLIDALEKRIGFLKTVADELELKDIDCIHMRAEDAGHDFSLREKFDVVLSRAVAPLQILSEYCMPLVKEDGYFLALKGPSPEEEIKEASGAIKILGGETERIEAVRLPGGIVHSIAVIKKVSHTPLKYPRKAGKPAKTPLK